MCVKHKFNRMQLFENQLFLLTTVLQNIPEPMQ